MTGESLLGPAWLHERAAQLRRERQEFESRYPKLLDRLEPLREKAPKIAPRPVPAVEELCEREGMEMPELIKRFRGEFLEFVGGLGGCISINERKEPLMERLYALHAAAKKTVESGSADEALSAFLTRESFNEVICPEATPFEHAWISRYVEHYMNVRVHSERLLETSTRLAGEGGEWSIHEADGDWVLLPEETSWSHGALYADRPVVEAAGELAESGYDRPDFTHNTNSRALRGIARHGGLLSALELLRRGEKPLTGEFNSQVNESGRYFDMMSANEGHGNGLGNVYASRGEQYSGYQPLQWFDDFRVSFGVSRAKQEEFLAKAEGERARGLGVLDFGSEGFLLGREVPLDAVTLIAVPLANVAEMEAWRDEHCPHAVVRPVEVLELLQSKGHTMNQVALEEGIDPGEAWRKLL